MNTPNHIAATENGVIFYSNRMPEAYGIHSYISGEKIKVERIDCQNFEAPNIAELSNRGNRISLLIPISLLLLLLIGLLGTGISNMFYILVIIPIFLSSTHQKLPKLLRMFFEVRKNDNRPHKSFLAAHTVCDRCKGLNTIPFHWSLEDVNNQQEYSTNFYSIVYCAIFSILYGIAFTFVPLQMNTQLQPFLIVLSIPIIIVVSIAIEFILKRLNIAKHFEQFFVTQATSLDLEVAIAALSEWLELEKEIEEFNNSLFLKD